MACAFTQLRFFIIFYFYCLKGHLKQLFYTADINQVPYSSTYVHMDYVSFWSKELSPKICKSILETPYIG